MKEVIPDLVDRVVIDRTGLPANVAFDIRLEWLPNTGVSGEPPLDINGPSIFTAIRDQLGLSLKSAKGPAEILLIDHVEKPGAN